MQVKRSRQATGPAAHNDHWKMHLSCLLGQRSQERLLIFKLYNMGLRRGDAHDF
jgi:hypothetical protein